MQHLRHRKAIYSSKSDFLFIFFQHFSPSRICFVSWKGMSVSQIDLTWSVKEACVCEAMPGPGLLESLASSVESTTNLLLPPLPFTSSGHRLTVKGISHSTKASQDRGRRLKNNNVSFQEKYCLEHEHSVWNLLSIFLIHLNIWRLWFNSFNPC